MGKALYRKYRSRKLSEIVGQEHVTTLLQNALTSGRIAHAYLFTGPRGTGKTSIARILAHEINKLPYSDESSHLDIIEIDAASNNGVDDIRELREKVNLAPTSAEKKIYIIDEVHMLSKPAFNALLKTLEEPPEHVVFILATTDIEKLPETIISRTQRHTFHRASKENIVANLQRIAEKEKISIDSQALELIAEHSDGGYRDSVSLLDQLANSSEKDETITAQVIETTLGLASTDAITQLLECVRGHDFTNTIKRLKDLENGGIQAKILADQLVRHIQSNIHEYPELLGLLDSLLDVGQSIAPNAKLLSVLGAHAAPAQKPHRAALAVTDAPRVINDPLPELAQKATEKHPVDDLVTNPTRQPQQPSQKKETPKEITKPVVKSKKATGNEALDEPQLLADAKENGIGIHSLLSQSSFTLEDGILTIYAKKEFNKKRLESTKNMRSLGEILAKQELQDIAVTIIPGQKPSEDSQIAAVTAIMGGGEEVSTDEVL